MYINKNERHTANRNEIKKIKAVDFENVRSQKIQAQSAHLLLVYFVTALVPSEMACFDSSPGKCNLTAVWISRLETVCFLL